MCTLENEAGVAGGRAGRLLLKSPNHTFRIRALIEAFPGAAYVWAVRDPRQVFFSNRRQSPAAAVRSGCGAGGHQGGGGGRDAVRADAYSEPLPAALEAALVRLQEAQRRALASHGV
ncbi:MAG: hypothetical protein A3H35_11845 [Betaproteobacteria bacterium RIFCSPLOWO2_02_FULL_62_17]|nr:MAG: hypothetical protein A3H35_11845 [Betaproteobacteria bacterium RIFCSPLOWO2_02_FULL_62_17]